jgi:hypothetical protein
LVSAQSRTKKALFTLIGLLMALVLLELLARAALFVSGRDYAQFREYNDWVHRTSTATPPADYDVSHPFLPYRPNPGHGDINGIGLRGPETQWEPSPGVLRIACLGGSTTFDNWYPLALEESMNVFLESHETPFHSCEVLNFGMASWTSMESLLNYTLRGVHLKPRIIVIYHAVNDAVAGCVLPGETARPDYSHWRTSWAILPRPVWDLLPGSLDRSRLLGLARYGLNRLSLAKVDPNQLFRCGIRYSYEPGLGETPFDTFGSNLSAMITVALNCSTTVFVVSQVHVRELTEEEFGSGELADRVSAMNREAEGVASELSRTGRVFFIDAALELPVQRDLMLDNCHFTPEGYAVLGDFIAGEMLAVLDSLQWDLSEPLDFR